MIKTLKALTLICLGVAVFKTAMLTTKYILDKNVEQTVTEQTIESITAESHTVETTAESHTVETTTYSEQTEQQLPDAPSIQPQNTEEYTITGFIGVNTFGTGDNYSIIRNADNMTGVLMVDENFQIHYFYDDNKSMWY